jgi:hypothetical protein
VDERDRFMLRDEEHAEVLGRAGTPQESASAAEAALIDLGRGA